MPFHSEWQLWAILNGAPAMAGGLLFLFAPALRQVLPILRSPRLEWIGHFETAFAWNIAARRSSILLGVGYVFRGLLFAQVLWATSWTDVRWIVWGNVLFAGVLLIATLVWGDLFHWRRPSAAGWLFLYIEEPVWMLTLVPATEASAGSTAGPGLSPILVVMLLVEAVVVGIVGLYLFFVAPREPDRVSPRILAGFALGWTGWAFSLAFAPSFEAASWGLLLNVVWVVASVAVILLLRRPRLVACETRTGGSSR